MVFVTRELFGGVLLSFPMLVNRLPISDVRCWVLRNFNLHPGQSLGFPVVEFEQRTSQPPGVRLSREEFQRLLIEDFR